MSKLKKLRLGYGNVSLTYYSSCDKFPTITIGAFKNDLDREVGREYIDCVEDVNDYLSLEFPNRESIEVLRKYLNQVEEYMESEERCLLMYNVATSLY